MTSAPALPAVTWTPGALVPGTVYRIIRPIGQGGMGEVFEVEHEMLGTRRALKVLMRCYARREDLTERLRVEARGLARLKHPNLVEVYDLGTAADGRIFFAMELLDGTTLRELLSTRGRLSAPASVVVAGQMLDGLHAAHQAGMVHRDIKPENVFICRSGMAKLLDFGVAKAIDAWMPEQRITGAGMTVGTPRYMAPEQAEGRPVDARTDVYAAGLVLWEMLVGAPAFDALDPYSLAVAKRTHGVRRLSDVMPGRVPVGVCDALQRACAIRPKDRYPTAEAFATDLRGTVDTSQRAPSSHPSLLPSASSRPHAGQTRPAGSAVVDPAAPTVAEHAGLTRMDGSRPMGPGGTRALRGAAQQELTERIDLAQSVDRDARTMRHGADARLLGPGGTELLPAVAARRSLSPPEPEGRVTGPASEAQPVSAYSAAGRLRAGLLASGWFAWVAGLFAFLVPVSLAAIFGYRHLSAPVEQPSSAASLPAVTASAAPAVTPLGSSMVQPAEEAEPVAVDLEVPRPPAHALPELRGPSSKAKVASTTSAPAPSARSSAVFRAAKPAAKVAATAATAVPKPVLAPPSKAEPHVDRRMPKSGL